MATGWQIAAVVGWLACAAGTYPLFRRLARSRQGHWTAADRRWAMWTLLALGPIGVCISLVLLVFEMDDRPAKW